MISWILVFWCLQQCQNQSKSRYEASDVGKTALETADMTKSFYDYKVLTASRYLGYLCFGVKKNSRISQDMKNLILAELH